MGARLHGVGRTNEDSNINADAVESDLNERRRAGRSLGEAAGEISFQKDKQMELGLLSKQSAREMEDIVDAWLAANSDEEGAAAERATATMYARFLLERVTLDISSHPMAQIESAWQEWRSGHQ